MPESMLAYIRESIPSLAYSGTSDQHGLGQPLEDGEDDFFRQSMPMVCNRVRDIIIIDFLCRDFC